MDKSLSKRRNLTSLKDRTISLFILSNAINNNYCLQFNARLNFSSLMPPSCTPKPICNVYIIQTLVPFAVEFLALN